MKLKYVKYEEFLPMKNPTDYKMPFVKAYSFRSKLYHEKMIENILLTSLNKMAYNTGTGKDSKVKTEAGGSNEKLIDKLVKRTECK
jgi:hypothetical protein